MEMSPSLALVAVVVVLLERSLTRVLVGLIMISNGINVLFLVAGGRAGGAPIVGRTPVGQMSDPLPQAMVLTAIVITLGITAFGVTIAYRSWQLTRHDEVQDDLEDRRVAERAALDLAAFEDIDATYETLGREAAETRDETARDEAAADAPVREGGAARG
jgi:multicomponent Na+:H+ antiporter subunit C